MCITASASGYAATGPEAREEIRTLNLSEEKNLAEISACLSQQNVLNYFTVREKLLKLPYAQLTGLYSRISSRPSFSGLKKLLAETISRRDRQGIYLVREDIFVNNVPLAGGSPFYGNRNDRQRIDALKPYAEHIYFDNLKLEYQAPILEKEDEKWWLDPQETQERPRVLQKTTIPPLDFREYVLTQRTAQEDWKYVLPGDRLTNYVYSMRQWFKQYEENAMRPVIYQDTVILRNEYRFFCLNRATGSMLWSVTVSDPDSREFYQTFRHPHMNSSGYEFLLAEDTVFSELAGKLVAIEVKDPLRPRLRWERPLGEYTAVTRPVLNAGQVFVGLINARGELWVCGFNRDDGSVTWSTYIGTCSFLSPECEISATAGNRVYFGTNHGVIVCIDAEGGKIVWLRKYSPRRYNIFDFWADSHFSESEKKAISYDTQFIVQDDARLYYKPRESEYLYIIDPYSGKMYEKILIDPARYYLLHAAAGKGVLLEKKTGEETAAFKIVDLDSGRTLSSIPIPGGTLQGTVYPDPDGIVCKIDAAVYSLRQDQATIRCLTLGAAAQGWLLAGDGNSCLLGEGRTLHSVGAVKEGYGYREDNASYNEYLARRERIKTDLFAAVGPRIKRRELSHLKKEIMRDLSAGGIPIEEIYPSIVEYRRLASDPFWNDFFAALSIRYGDEIVPYKEVRIRFRNFLYENGFVAAAASAPENRGRENVRTPARPPRQFQARGEKLFPLPIQTIEPQAKPAVTLALNNDQVLCIDEDGTVLWGREVFYRPYPPVNYDIKYATDMNRGRMYADDIEAYLYHNVLIINDHVNIVAVRVDDGRYLWSMTNDGDVFAREKEVPLKDLDELYKTFGVRRSFLKNIMFFTTFLDEKLIVVHGNRICAVNPLTGYCVRLRELPFEGTLAVTSAAGNIYVMSYFLDGIGMFDKDLNMLMTIPLDFMDVRQAYPEIINAGTDIVVRTLSSIYIIDGEKGKMKERIDVPGPGRSFVDTYRDQLVIIVPLKEVVSYRLGRDSVTKAWQVDWEDPVREAKWKYLEKKARYYFKVDHSLIVPLPRMEGYSFARIDLATGKILWQRQVEEIRGLFYDLSECARDGDVLYFVISTGCGELDFDRIKDEAWDSENVFSIPVKARLVGLNLDNGDVETVESFPSLCANRMILKNGLVETEHSLVYSGNGKILRSRQKER